MRFLNLWICTGVILLLPFCIDAQEEIDRKRIALLLESRGMSLGFSVQLDYMLDNPVCGTWSIKGGLGSFNYVVRNQEGTEIPSSIWTIPISASYLIGKNNHFFEAGGGMLGIHSDFEGSSSNRFFDNAGFSMAIFGNTGYRYQALRPGGIIRVSWNPVINKAGFALNRFGIGVGFSL